MQAQGCVSGELMGDLEEAEAEKGCRGERYTIDEINLALSSQRLQQEDD